MRPRCSLVTSLRLRTVWCSSLSIRSATATNSRPAAVISTRRVLRANSVTPSTRSTRLMVRVSAGCDVFEIRRGCHEAAVFGQRHDRQQLAGADVRDVGWMHARMAADLFASRNCIAIGRCRLLELSKPW